MTPLERVEISCDACFFRQAELCAIPGNTPCPTFRPVRGVLAVRQTGEALTPRPELGVAASAAA